MAERAVHGSRCSARCSLGNFALSSMRGGGAARLRSRVAGRALSLSLTEAAPARALVLQGREGAEGTASASGPGGTLRSCDMLCRAKRCPLDARMCGIKAPECPVSDCGATRAVSPCHTVNGLP